MKIVLRKEILNYLFIVSGSFLLAFGVVAFLSPNNIATGGTAGLAIVLHHVIDLPIGIWMGLINVPLVLISFKYLGKQFAFKTILCILCIAIFVDLLAEVIKLQAFSKELLLATLYGGICIGTGLGLIFKGGASAGGATIIARLITSRTSIKTSTVILILDGIVIVSAGIVFKSIELSLWSMIGIYASTKLIDVVLIGAPTQKIVHISSLKNLNELSKMVFENMGISGTIVKGEDISGKEHKDIIFLMIDKNRLTTLKQLVHQYDDEVKMIVMEAAEILGK